VGHVYVYGLTARQKLRFARNVQIKSISIENEAFSGLWFLKSCLQAPESTGFKQPGLTDLALMKWPLRGVVGQGVFLFSRINASDKKRAYLAKLARKQPNFTILGPTASVVVFSGKRFTNAHVVPYPISGQVHNDSGCDDDFTGTAVSGCSASRQGYLASSRSGRVHGRLKLGYP